jgi:hypothetical protein
MRKKYVYELAKINRQVLQSIGQYAITIGDSACKMSVGAAVTVTVSKT